MCSDPEDPTPGCDGGGNKASVIHKKKTNPVDERIAKQKQKYRNGFQTPPYSSMPTPVITVGDLLSENPGFNPFTNTLENPNDYPFSEHERMDTEILALYGVNGIDLDYYAAMGSPNPLKQEQVPSELQIRLLGPAQSIELSYFLAELSLNHGNVMNYEPNYVFSLMNYHPTALQRAIYKYRLEVPPLLENLENFQFKVD